MCVPVLHNENDNSSAINKNVILCRFRPIINIAVLQLAEYRVNRAKADYVKMHNLHCWTRTYRASYSYVHATYKITDTLKCSNVFCFSVELVHQLLVMMILKSHWPHFWRNCTISEWLVILLLEKMLGHCYSNCMVWLSSIVRSHQNYVIKILG